MPHVIVKLYAGRSEQQKTNLAEEISKAVMAVLKADEESVSVAVEDLGANPIQTARLRPDENALPIC